MGLQLQIFSHTCDENPSSYQECPGHSALQAEVIVAGPDQLPLSIQPPGEAVDATSPEVNLLGPALLVGDPPLPLQLPINIEAHHQLDTLTWGYEDKLSRSSMSQDKHVYKGVTKSLPNTMVP